MKYYGPYQRRRYGCGQHETPSLGSAARRQEVSPLGRVRQGRVVRKRGEIMAGPTAASCGPIGGA